ncbi:coproporphyrinogen III oxidase [Shouchella lonarensis]|uniref:Coproporphyrinogen III oxidase, anaerobic n=1 Tax=Shouchella lonarensis TaxID=1464122 RepID=A0A1G6IHH1_9BACI|nr:coproporphyrinogen III oxidase [Shouchella lonarensis]SDC05465.1 coproporphyrinogen III oxidase, anaerobic [Shouchella lonarensis]
MLVHIRGLNSSYEHALFHLFSLFYEQVQLQFVEKLDGLTQNATPSLMMDVHITEDTKVSLTLTTSSGHARTMKGTYPQSSVYDTSDMKKKEKRTVRLLLLRLLEAYTGIHQPWGVLTGIRPTKLMHQMRRAGLTKKEIETELTEVYAVSEEKISLLSRIMKRQLSVLPDLDTLDRGVSIYIGIPFCPTKCAYCTFPAYAINETDGSVASFLEGLHYEMSETGEWLRTRNIAVTTIYYGGGTPTSITAEEMDALYAHMYKVFPHADQVRELTVEAGRPDTITPDKLEVLKKYNVDRMSINPQSFTNETLEAIGRHHSVEETIEKFQLAKTHGIENINMDLIIGLPGEGIAEMAHTLGETEKLQPTSLTVHTLSFKRASDMTKNRSKYQVAGREEIKEMMAMANEWMTRHHYEPYYLYRQKNILGNLENVGYACPDRESLYNIIIMEECQTIIGLGCGAASKFVKPGTGKITRYANPKNPRAYRESYKEYTMKKLTLLSETFDLR